MKSLLLGLGLAALAGCASLERDTTAKFSMLTESQWMMEALTRHYSKPDDPAGEAEPHGMA
jgi:type IV pilus biogenesis protein CpaD/CtpE